MKSRAKVCASMVLAIVLLLTTALPALAADADHKIYVNGYDVFSSSKSEWTSSVLCGAGDVTAVTVNGQAVHFEDATSHDDTHAVFSVGSSGESQGQLEFYKDGDNMRIKASGLTVNVTIAITTSEDNAAPAKEADIVINTERDASYKAYRILNLTTALTGTCEHDGDDEPEPHTSDCYTYQYTVNGKYEAAVRAALKTAGIADTDGMNNTELVAAIASMKDNSDKVRTFADALYAEVKNLDADETAVNKQFSDVAQGYYLIVDTSNTAGKDEATSLVMLDTAGKEKCEVDAKDSVPTLTKKVEELDDSDDADDESDGMQDAADHDIGDAVKFSLTGTLPEEFPAYKKYRYVFHDKLASGFTFDASSVVVTVDGTAVAAKTAAAGDDGESSTTGYYTVKTTGLTDTCTFEVIFDDIKKVPNIKADSKVVVTYTATLNDSAKVGEDGNTNTSYLEFSNDPYYDGNGDGGTGKTPEDVVIVFTYKLIVEKVDAQLNALAGAEFELYKYMADTKTYEPTGRQFKLKDTTDNVFELSGLDSGKYMLVETKVPDGYNKAEDVYFEIVAEYDKTGDPAKLTSLKVVDSDGKEISEFVVTGMTKTDEDDGEAKTGKITGDISTKVVNNTGIRLPSTGGAGLVLLYAIGMTIVVAGVGFLAIRNKKSELR